MADLITDLERGPGSRELSDQVLMALGAVTREYYEGFKTPWFYYDKKGHMIYEDKRPDPTRNLQDAVNLVPNDLHLECYADGDFWVYACEGHPVGYGSNNEQDACGLCIALLRAAQTKGREE